MISFDIKKLVGLKRIEELPEEDRKYAIDFINNNAIEVVSLNGLLLKYINPEIENYGDIALVAVNQNVSSIDYISKKISNNYYDILYEVLEMKLLEIKTRAISNTINNNFNSNNDICNDSVIELSEIKKKDDYLLYEAINIIKECFNSFLKITRYQTKYLDKINEFCYKFQQDVVFLGPLVKKNIKSIDLKIELK